MHDACVGEPLSDAIEVCKLAKREMMDLEGVVKLESFHVQVHLDIAKGVMADVEVTWDAESLNETLNAAALPFRKFTLNPLCNVPPICCLLSPALS